MERTVSAHLECDVTEPIDLVLSVAVAEGPTRRDESLSVTLGGKAIEVTEIVDDHGSRLHVADAVSVGALVVDYTAVVTSLAPTVEVRPVDLIRYLRPSRYCESDKLSAVAHAEFAGLSGAVALASHQVPGQHRQQHAGVQPQRAHRRALTNPGRWKS